MYHVECVINRLNACEKSFKILKCSPEAVNQRWTENTMLNVKKRIRTKNAVQYTTHNTKDRATLNTDDEHRCSGGISS